MNKKPISIANRRHRYHAKITLNLVSLIVIAFLASYQSKDAQASHNVFYVAPNGNDNNPGTLSKPWRTIEHAASSSDIHPGDIVYIRGGVYDEYIQQNISGSPGKPITYINYPGEQPIITGSGNWRWHILEQSHIRIKGITFRDFQKGAIQIRTRKDNISNIEVINCTFENQSPLNNDGAKTIHVTTTETDFRVSNVTIRGNSLQNVDTGDHPAIQVAGDAHYIQIVNNTIKNTSSIAIGIAGRPEIDQPTNILIKGNEVTGHSAPDKHSAGIYLDGAGENIIVEENVIYEGLQGIKVSLESAAAELTTRHVIVRRNVLYNNSQINLKVGVGDSSQDCNQSGLLEESVAVHNTVFTSLEDVTNHRFSCGQHLRWKNNIFADASNGTSFQYKLSDDITVPSSTWLMDFNLFYNAQTNGYYRWQGVTYESLASFKTASGQDINSFAADPRFVDMEQRDFQLESNSAARDAGDALTFATSTGSGTVVPVNEAWYFSDGLGLQDGDLIRVGDSDPVAVVAVDYDNNTITVDQSISWQNQDDVNYAYEGTAPDVGAFEFEPTFDLIGIPADKAIHLRWDINEVLPPTAVLQIEYSGPQGSPASPIAAIPLDTRQLSLTGLENYTFYDITLLAMDNGSPILTDTIRVMPTDIFSYLPLVVESK